MRAFENAIIRLLKRRPFYASFILNLKRIETKSGKAAGVTIADGSPAITINSENFSNLTNNQQEYIFEHLVQHLVRLHPLRRRDRNRYDWDICCDLAVNSLSENNPDDAVMPDSYGMEPGLAAEEYYDALVNPFSTGNLDGSGYGDGEEDSAGAAGDGKSQFSDAETIDDHDCWELADSTPELLAEEMIRAITAEALKGSDGEAPQEICEAVSAILTPPKLPWQAILRQFAATAGRVGKRSTWQREHRRFGSRTPGIRKKQRLNLLVAVDVSDSTKDLQLRENFAQELIHIARGRESQITVLYSGSRIQKIEKFSGVPAVVERYDGGGFTDLRPVFEYAQKMHPLPAAVIYLTDGFGEAPERMEFPTLWVLTGEGVKPVEWGVELRLQETVG